MSKNIIRIKGEKVNLCPIRSDEEAIKLYQKWMNDESILMWIGRNDKIATYLDEVDWVERRRDANSIYFNIVDADTDELVGNCDLKIVGNSRNVTLGICIGEENARNKGYGTETIKLLIKFAFEELNAHRVMLQVNGDNIRAIKCYTKAGFNEVGREHETHWYNGHWCDTIIMEILEQDWYK